jgi:DnaJ-domain-containing protein 1
MHLPGRLRATTLGDLLGTLHRAGATGTLELAELRGRVHRIHMLRGYVAAVELDGASASLAEMLRRRQVADEETLRRSLLRAMSSRRLHGEVLVREFRLSPSVVDDALRAQLVNRLEILDQLADAQICFRVAIRPPRGALTDEPLRVNEFLPGRRRARDRTHDARPPSATPRPRVDACRILGVPDGADPTEVKRAYRRLVHATHPDLHPLASAEEKRALAARFQQITEAYRSLVA